MLSSSKRGILQALSRTSWLSSTRSLPKTPYRPTLAHRTPCVATRRYTTSVGSSQSAEQVSFPVTPDRRELLISRAQEFWPPPPSIPPGWSCTWRDWEYLVTLYWLSPYYLRLLQIEMLVNIRHRIPGETRPLLFSNQYHAVIFTLVKSPTEFFFLSIEAANLYRIGGVKNELELVQLMAHGKEAIRERLHLVPQDEEGKQALDMILERNEAVIPLLAQKFLTYTPAPTELSEELSDMEIEEDNASSTLEEPDQKQK